MYMYSTCIIRVISPLLIQSSGDISEMEREMDSLYESAGLFEVNVPDYKQLKACRKYVVPYPLRAM